MRNSVSPNDCVLVIDDDVVMRELLPLLLDADGRTIFTAESGDAALALLAGLPPEKLPSIILTDLKMPGISGGALASLLRLACPPPALLIAMSGSQPVAGEDKAFDAFLRKPFSMTELEATLVIGRTTSGKHLAKIPKRPGTRRKRGSNSVDLSASGEVPALDEAIYAKLLSVMGPAQLPELYAMFMNDAPDRIARMKSAVTANDAATFVREAHAIKGGCGMLGATEIHSLAGKMEAGGLACSPLLVDFQTAFERLRRILNERMMIV